MKKRFCAILALFAAIALSGCINLPLPCIIGSGNVVSEARNIGEFSGIVVNGFGTVYLSQGETSLSLDGEDNVLEIIETEIVDGKLLIGPAQGQCVQNAEPLNIYVSTPSIESLAINGSGKYIGETKIESEKLLLEINGSGELDLDLETEELETIISGSGNVLLSGKADMHKVTISGFGNVLALGLKTVNSNITINASGEAKVNASHALNVAINGSGKVQYTGNPTIKQSIFGSGKVEQVSQSETYCETDSDCACGTHIDTGECFTGNKEFVNVETQCPDFCSGIAGNVETNCVQNTCTNTVPAPTGGITVDNSEFLEGLACDTSRLCPNEFECASFPGFGLSCYPAEKEVCSFVTCPEGKECVVAESYPVQVFCG